MAVPSVYTMHMTNNQLPMNLQDRYEVRDGFIIKKGETDPAIFAAMESIKADMLREAAYRKDVREGRIPAPSGQWGIWNISDRH
jgi:hypothetical protein